MSGETNLDKLLSSMQPSLRTGEFVFCTVSKKEADCMKVKPTCSLVEDEGLTLILRKEEAQELGLEYVYPCRMITLKIHSSLEAVGFIAAIATRLAQAGISVNPVSGYFHDHLFVPIDKAERAIELLKEFSN